MKARTTRSPLASRLRRVRCLLLDVDGVLTDGRLYVGADGREWKAFDIKDGAAIKLAQLAGLKVGWISARPSPATARRARELAVDWLFQGPRDKGELIGEIERTAGIPAADICYVGDDLLDIPALHRVGLPVAVADAPTEVRRAARLVTRAPGGRGAVREVVERILKTKGLWNRVLQRYWGRSSSPRQ